MIEIQYLPVFLRQFRKLTPALQEEVFEKTELFKDPDSHKMLRVHKLKGKLKNRYSFSVNYSVRIVFIYTSKEEVAFLAVGDHEVYA